MIGIIGGGISGLSLAYFLQKANIPYQLFEASNKVGGLINTTKSDNYILETGPNSILCAEEIIELLHEWGLKDDIIYPNYASKFRFVVKNGKLQKLPSGPLSLLFGNYFSSNAKINLLKEYFNKSTTDGSESVASFFNRRFGSEITDYAVNPFVTGIYAGDPSRLLVNQTFPQLVAYEKDFGSVIKGVIKNKSGKRKQSLNFKNGMEQLPIAIASHLEHLMLDTTVRQVVPSANGFKLNTSKGEFEVQKLVICTPSYIASKLLVNIDPDAATAFDRIEYAVTTAVYSSYNQADVTIKPEGFGALNPAKESRFSAGTIWTSSIMPYRTNENEILFTTFVGGTGAEEKAMLPDEEILEKVHQDLKEIYQISNKPVFTYIKRWSQAIPQYTRIALESYKLIPKLERRGVYINANWKDGVSLSDRILNSRELAKIIDKI